MKITIKMMPLILLSCAGTTHGSEPENVWWDGSTRGDKTLPELVDEGWKVVGYSTSPEGDALSRDYILQHHDKPGAWHCNFFSFTMDDGSNEIIKSCMALVQP